MPTWAELRMVLQSLFTNADSLFHQSSLDGLADLVGELGKLGFWVTAFLKVKVSAFI